MSAGDGAESDQEKRILNGYEMRIRDLEDRVKNLEAWRQMQIGAVIGIGIMTGAYAKEVGGALHQMLKAVS